MRNNSVWAGVFLVGSGLALGYAWWSGAVELVLSEVAGMVQGTAPRGSAPVTGPSSSTRYTPIGAPAVIGPAHRTGLAPR